MEHENDHPASAQDAASTGVASPTARDAARAVFRPAYRVTLLVLIALGGAGLAVAADRPQNPVMRPELTWRADHAAAPHIEALANDLAPVDADIQSLSEHAQQILGSIIGLDLNQVDASLAAGDETAARLETAEAEVLARLEQARASMEEWRLGTITRDVFDRLSSAADAAQHVPGYWRSLAARARLVSVLVSDLRQHDDLVFEATSAGRAARWQDALDLLAEAETRLAEARAARDQVAAQADVSTLDDLLARDAEYDAALADLYAYVRDTGNLQGAAFDTRQRRVNLAQSALPRDNSALTVIVAEAAGPQITDSLVGIEEARGAVLDALEAVQNPPEPTEEPLATELPAGPVVDATLPP